MSVGLRLKIFVVLFVLTATVFAGQLLLMWNIVFPQFVTLEEESGRRDMVRTQQAISSELNSLDILCHDWAFWDDAVDFVEGRGTEFIRINMPEDFYTATFIDYISFVNVQGEVVFRRAIDPLTGDDFVVAGHDDGAGKLSFAEHGKADQVKSGLLYVGDVPEPLLLVARPIVPSDRSDDIRGTLVMGRFLRIDVLRQKVGVDFVLQAVAGRPLLDENPDVLSLLLSGAETPLLRYNNDLVYSYSLQNNIYGSPLFLIIGQKPAEIILHGKKSIYTSMLYYLFVSILFLLTVFFLMTRIVTHPIRSLCVQIRKIVTSGDFSIAIRGVSSGEIGELRQGVNDLLGRIISHEKLLFEANTKLLAQSLTDPLTGLANRRDFDSYMDNEWKRLQRSKLPLSVVMCDVDFFKKYNDAYGHLKGDTCLQELATSLCDACLRPADLPARYGGEEFVVVLPETDGKGAMYVAQRICDGVHALQLEHVVSSVCPFVTMSVGVATIVPSLQHDPDYLVRMADDALYQAKEQGRNRVVMFKG